MRKLNLSDWASVAEIAGTFAVVISLVLIASSLERNTAAVSGQTADDMYEAMRTINLNLLGNSELMMVTIKGSVDPNSLSELEREQFKAWAALRLDLWERLYVRQQDGLVQAATVDGWHEYFAEWAKRQLPREIWEEIKWMWPGGDFADRVDAALSN